MRDITKSRSNGRRVIWKSLSQWWRSLDMFLPLHGFEMAHIALKEIFLLSLAAKFIHIKAAQYSPDFFHLLFFPLAGERRWVKQSLLPEYVKLILCCIRNAIYLNVIELYMYIHNRFHKSYMGPWLNWPNLHLTFHFIKTSFCGEKLNVNQWACYKEIGQHLQCEWSLEVCCVRGCVGIYHSACFIALCAIWKGSEGSRHATSG